MTTSRIESEGFYQFDSLLYQEHLTKIIQPVIPQFDKCVKSYLYFNLFFLFSVIIEGVFLFLFFSSLAKSSLLAFAFAFIFFTFFAYFVFRIYFLSTRSEKINTIRCKFIESCKQFIHYHEGVPEHHLALANACCKLSDHLNGKEYTYYRLPAWLHSFSQHIENFSFWWHWEDLHSIREALLTDSLAEHIKLVCCEPTSLEVHAALANAYVMLSTFYSSQIKHLSEGKKKWYVDTSFTEKLNHKFRQMAECAIEEFKILCEYAPHDPWVHLQLAYSYQDLNMPLEEIHQYELLLKIDPDDYEAMYKLGTLYFQQGMNARGLRVYEELKNWNYKRAENLIKHYGQARSFS